MEIQRLRTPGGASGSRLRAGRSPTGQKYVRRSWSSNAVLQSTATVTGPGSGPSKLLASIQLIPANRPLRAAMAWLVTSVVKTAPPLPLAVVVVGVAAPPTLPAAHARGKA